MPYGAEQTEEEKDCPRGAWIELLTIGLLCRGAFHPASGRFKASVDSRRRGITASPYIYVYHAYTHAASKYNNITGCALSERKRERERALAPMRDQSYLAEKGAYPSAVGAETIQRLFIGLERVPCCLHVVGNVGRKQPRDNCMSLSRVFR